MSRWQGWLFFVMASGWLLSGCDQGPTVVRPQAKSLADVESDDYDDLNQGLIQLFNLNDYDPGEVERFCLYNLNQWLLKANKQGQGVEWHPDPLLKRLPQALASIQQVNEVNRERYTGADLRFLHGRILMRDLSRWVSRKAPPAEFKMWLDSRSAELTPDEVTQLTTAWLLFDWVVRNIQLDPLPPVAEGSATNSAASALAAQKGEEGGGYRHYAHDVMFVSHGDAWERMNLYVNLCRQAGIDAVLLGMTEEKNPWRPWVVGVMIGVDLYLFDCELGLPLPVADFQGVATLREVIAQPELLRQLDLDEKRPYSVVAADLQRLEARLVATPEELSLRMAKLQPNLKAEFELTAFVRTEQQVEKLKRIKEISPAVSLWNAPLLACLYNELGKGLRRNKDLPYLEQIVLEGVALIPGSESCFARNSHLQGQFDPVGKRPGAISMLIASRPTEYSLDDIRLSDKFRERVGLSKSASAEEEKQRRDWQYRSVERLRETVSYWLGLIQFEKGEYETAIDWFDQRGLKLSPENYWTPSLRYNLARAYEITGNVKEATRLYRLDSSPQRHGNLLRARRLTAKAE